MLLGGGRKGDGYYSQWSGSCGQLHKEPIEMKIYIATSWKNQHAVELLTARLRGMGHEVLSFVEKSAIFERDVLRGKMNFDDWVWSKDGEEKFRFDIEGATRCDLMIYISPAGTDAWAEVGAAWASGVSIIGLYAKGEPSGLMRRMITWVNSVEELLDSLDRPEGYPDPNCSICKGTGEDPDGGYESGGPQGWVPEMCKCTEKKGDTDGKRTEEKEEKEG